MLLGAELNVNDIDVSFHEDLEYTPNDLPVIATCGLDVP